MARSDQSAVPHLLPITLIVKLQKPMLPEASVALHEMLVDPSVKFEGDGKLQTATRPVSTLSATVTLLANANSKLRSLFALAFSMLPGQVTAGGSLSVTVTLKAQVPTLPDASVALHST